MTKKIIPPVHLACSDDDLRIAMQYVMIKDNVAYATNANIAVAVNLVHHSELSDDVIKELNGKYVHKDTWKRVMDAEFIFIEGDEILYSKGMTKARFEISTDINFPDVVSVLKEAIAKNEVQMCKVSFNPLLVDTIRKVFAYTEMNFILKGSHILCYPCIGSYQYGLIMPIIHSELTEHFEFDIN